jgi:hemin uptake protein HemP
MTVAIPSHDALHLTQGGAEARIVLGEQTYVLRITRAGKLILTK